MHFSLWKWSIDLRTACGPFFCCLCSRIPGCPRCPAASAAPGPGPSPGPSPSRPLCAPDTPFMHKLPFLPKLCAQNTPFVHKLPHRSQISARNTPFCTNISPSYPPDCLEMIMEDSVRSVRSAHSGPSHRFPTVPAIQQKRQARTGSESLFITNPQ